MLVSDACAPSDGRGADSYEGNLQVHGVFTYMYMLPKHLNLSPSRVDGRYSFSMIEQLCFQIR